MAAGSDAGGGSGVLSDARAELCAWAREWVAEPWSETCRTAAAIMGVAREDAPESVRFVMTPFRLDFRGIVPIAGRLMPYLLFPSARLLTVIVDPEAQRVTHAYFERTAGGNFVSIRPVYAHGWRRAFEGAWVRDVAGEDLRQLTDDRLRPVLGERIDWVKVASIDFFSHFRGAQESYASHGNAAKYIADLWRAVVRVHRLGQISFHPEPPVFRLLAAAARRFGDWDPTGWVRGWLDFTTRRPGGVVLCGGGPAVGFLLDGAEPHRLSLDADALAGTESMPPGRVAVEVRRRTGLCWVVALRAGSVERFVQAAVGGPLPWSLSGALGMLGVLGAQFPLPGRDWGFSCGGRRAA